MRIFKMYKLNIRYYARFITGCRTASHPLLNHLTFSLYIQSVQRTLQLSRLHRQIPPSWNDAHGVHQYSYHKNIFKKAALFAMLWFINLGDICSINWVLNQNEWYACPQLIMINHKVICKCYFTIHSTKQWQLARLFNASLRFTWERQTVHLHKIRSIPSYSCTWQDAGGKNPPQKSYTYVDDGIFSAGEPVVVCGRGRRSDKGHHQNKAGPGCRLLFSLANWLHFLWHVNWVENFLIADKRLEGHRAAVGLAPCVGTEAVILCLWMCMYIFNMCLDGPPALICTSVRRLCQYSPEK